MGCLYITLASQSETKMIATLQPDLTTRTQPFAVGALGPTLKTAETSPHSLPPQVAIANLPGLSAHRTGKMETNEM